MRFYRIKQTDKDTYIPQVWRLGWEGIDRGINCGTWYGKEYQRLYCSVSSLEKAKSVINDYKEYIKSKKQYPKYHRV